jgi:LemA protein
MLWVVLGVLVLLVLFVVSLYNKLVSLRVRADATWSDIDTQLKRRHDLIPNLVETVKGYAAHERGVFEQVAEARSRAMGATTPAQSAQAEGLLTQALGRLFAVAEAYPELKANQNFLSLQQTLAGTEDAISGSRRAYNEVVRDLNTRIETAPSNIIASMFNFRRRDFFEIQDAAERTVPQVRF